MAAALKAAVKFNAAAHSETQKGSAVKCAVRLRPLVSHEKGQKPCLAINDGVVSVIPEALGEEQSSLGPWKFDAALDSSNPSSPLCATNEEVYNILGRNIVQHAVDGFNACLFCYGQTGTGKTTTILGDKHAGPGLLIYLFQDLFEYKNEEESHGNTTTIGVEMLEVYNEKVFDLLQEIPEHGYKANVQMHVLPTGVEIKGTETKFVSSVDECLALIDLGNTRKHIAATLMNPQSSRGHTVFKLSMSHFQQDEGVMTNSEIYFADLAGHESEKTTKVQGDRLTELSFINKSLMWLQSAIHAMAKKGKHGHGEPEDNRMRLFRNSKLTLLLSNALLGNSLVNVIVTLSPAAAHFETSLGSLKFANEVKHVKVEVKSSAHVDPQVQIRKLEAEVKSLKEQLALANKQGSAQMVPMSITRSMPAAGAKRVKCAAEFAAMGKTGGHAHDGHTAGKALASLEEGEEFDESEGVEDVAEHLIEHLSAPKLELAKKAHAHDTFAAENERLTSMNRTISEKHDAFVAENDRLTSMNRTISEKLAARDAEKHELHHEIAKRTRAHEELHMENRKKSAVHHQLRSEIAKKTTAHDTFASENEFLRTRVKTLERDLQESQARVQGLHADLEAWKSVPKKPPAGLEGYSAENEYLRICVKNLQQELRESKASVRSLNADLEDWQTSSRRLSAVLADIAGLSMREAQAGVPSSVVVPRDARDATDGPEQPRRSQLRVQ